MVYGIGICDAGRHTASVGTKNSSLYKLWQRMFTRCYGETFLRDRPTYRGCSVHPEFVRFQSFGDWAVAQTGYARPGTALDKDLLVKGNKVYGPNTCVFLPSELNQLINTGSGNRGEFPIGVHLDKRYNNFYALLSLKVDGVKRSIRLGTFTTVEAAFNAYKLAKEARIKEMATYYKKEIEPRAFDALFNYEVGTND